MHTQVQHAHENVKRKDENVLFGMQAEGKVGGGWEGGTFPVTLSLQGVTCFQLWEINLKITEIQEFIAD